MHPALLLRVAPGGVPNWVPHLTSSLLVLAALLTWRLRIDSGLLAAWWGLGAGAFARPAILASNGELWTEVLLLPVLVGLVLLAATPSTPARTRLAVLGALGAPIAVAACLGLFEAGLPPWALAGPAYTIILISAGLSVRYTSQLRRSPPC